MKEVVADFGIPVESLAGTGVSANVAISLLSDSPIRFIQLDGINTPELFWERIAMPDLTDFFQNPTARGSFHVATALASMVEWVWHKEHPNENTRSNRVFAAYCSDLRAKCPAIQYVREIANAAKHCGLTESKNIKTVRTNTPELRIYLNDGTDMSMADVFSNAADYWKGVLKL